MATTVSQANIVSDVNVKEKLSKSTLEDKIVTHRIKDEQILTSATTIDAELVYSGMTTLSDGSATLDLKALTNAEGDTIVTEGKKVRVFKAKATSTNANALTLAAGASNGYLLGGAAWKFALSASDSIMTIHNNNAPAVGDSSKNIDLTGTGAQSVDIVIVFG